MVSVQSTCQVSGDCGMTEVISMLTISFAARLNGLASALPLSHSFVLAVAGSLGDSIEYTRNTALRCKATSGVTRRASVMNVGHRGVDDARIGLVGRRDRPGRDGLPQLVHFAPRRE